MFVGHHFSTVPPDFQNSASSFFLLVACTSSCFLYCISLLLTSCLYSSLFSFLQHYTCHLPVLSLYSKQDFLASSWPFVLFNFWHIFLPYCHLCSSIVCCLILASLFMLLLLFHILTHFQKSPTVSGCAPRHRPLQLTQPHFCVAAYPLLLHAAC